MRRVTLLITPLLATLITTSSFAASSNEIRDSISKQVDLLPLGKHEIEIDVTRGKVSLRGTVASDAARRQVEEIATNTEGVQRVESFLTIDSSAVSAQQQLARSVWQNIQAHSNLGIYKIEILGKGDRVVLSGTAGSEETRLNLENIARQTPGVQAVENSIVIIG